MQGAADASREHTECRERRECSEDTETRETRELRVQRVLSAGSCRCASLTSTNAHPRTRSQALDARTGEPVAVKRLHQPFESAIHAKRVMREIRLLRFLNHTNIIGLRDLFVSYSPPREAAALPAANVYIVTELMSSDFRRLLRAQPLGDEHIQFLSYQLVRALVYLHSAGIIHRDISPANIAVNEDCDVKLLDFGLARKQVDERAADNPAQTGYVQKKWYRAVEVILHWGHYDQQVDMWSVGCILAEMICMGEPLFPARESHVDHLRLIIKLLGKPSAAYIANISSEAIQKFISEMPEQPRVDFQAYFRSRFPEANPLAIDLIDKLLVYEPELRLSAAQAIQHPYFAGFHAPEDEPVCLQAFDDSFESFELDLNGWKDLVLHEVEAYQAEKLAAFQHQLQQQQHQLS
eukprot:m.78101 g.78101  ORF g.78101 m.78101 type:complete len:408 (+) comp8155_c0_seq3:307-1530(+)